MTKPLASLLSLLILLSPAGAAAQVRAIRAVAAPRAQAGFVPGRAAATLAGPSLRLAPAALTVNVSLPQAPAPLAGPSAEVLPAELSALLPAAARPGPAAAAVREGGPSATAAQIGAQGPSQGTDGNGELAAESGTESEPSAGSGGFFGALKRAVSALGGRAVFDGTLARGGFGIVPTGPILLPNGSRPDAPPTTPAPEQSPAVTVNSFEIPETEAPAATEGIFEAGQVVLQADPSDAASVKAALRALVDSDVQRFGVRSAELATIHVKRVATGAAAGVAPTVYAYFRQMKDGIEVHGSYLSFTVKELQGRAVVVATMVKLFPGMNADTTARFTEDELRQRAQDRVGLPPQLAQYLESVGQRIIFSGGAWRAATIFVLPGMPFAIAVDVATGEAFAWDARASARKDGAAGRFTGRGEKTDDLQDGAPIITELPVSRLHLNYGGRKYVTDSQGRFTLDKPLEAPVTIEAKLVGDYISVEDQAGNPLSASITLKPGPGHEAVAVFNAEGADEFAVAQINAYYHPTWGLDWLLARIGDDKRVQKQIPARVNIDDHGNAYYTPWRPSINLFRSTDKLSQPAEGKFKFRFTARAGIIYHEYLGHYVDDMLGGIVNGGMSEGWGDIMAMYILNSPVIGQGFFKDPPAGRPDHIRNGENTHPYAADDAPHDQGQVWMGFAWKLRKALIAAAGAAAGAALSEALVLPTLLAKAADIPAAIAQVLVNDMDSQGRMPHEAQIREAARIHGVEIPRSPKAVLLARGLAMAAASRLTAVADLRLQDNGSTGPAESAAAPVTAAELPGRYHATLAVEGPVVAVDLDLKADGTYEIQVGDREGHGPKLIGRWQLIDGHLFGSHEVPGQGSVSIDIDLSGTSAVQLASGEGAPVNITSSLFGESALPLRVVKRDLRLR